MRTTTDPKSHTLVVRLTESEYQALAEVQRQREYRYLSDALRSCIPRLRIEQAAPAEVKQVIGRKRPQATLLDIIRSIVTVDAPLVFVPSLAAKVRRDVRQELLELAKAGAIELRPESDAPVGPDALTAEQKAACPVGGKGEVLSYLRVV